MPFKNYLSKELIFLDRDFTNMEEVLQFLSFHFQECTGKEAPFIYNLLKQREEIGSTWVGHGTVLPHNHNQEIEGIHIIFIRCRKPLELEDGNEAKFIVSILTSGKQDNIYLGILQGIGKLMSELSNELERCSTPDELLDLLTEDTLLPGLPIKASDLVTDWPHIMDDSTLGAALDMMKQHKVYLLPVLSSKDNKLCGVLDFIDLLKAGFPDYVFSLSDLSIIQDFKPVKYFWQKENELFVKDYIRDYRSYIVRNDASYPEIFFLMVKGNRRHLLVMDCRDKLIGVISPNRIIDKMLRP